jgi:hypothetical protein
MRDGQMAAKRRPQKTAARTWKKRREIGGNSAAKGRHGRKKTAGNRRRIFAAPLDRNENVLVLAFCSFLMKADLGEAGQNLLIPCWQQQRVHGRKNGGKSAAIVQQKGGTAVKRRNGGESAANFCGPPWSEGKSFSFSFLLILDEGGFRGGRAESAYSSLAATACPRHQKPAETEGNRRQNHNKQQPASLQSKAYRADLDSKWFPTVKVAEFFEPKKKLSTALRNVEFQGASFGSFGKIHNFSVLQ